MIVVVGGIDGIVCLLVLQLLCHLKRSEKDQECDVGRMNLPDHGWNAVSAIAATAENSNKTSKHIRTTSDKVLRPLRKCTYWMSRVFYFQ